MVELNYSHCEDQCEKEPLRNVAQPNVDGSDDVTTTLTPAPTTNSSSSSPSRRRRVRRGEGGGGGGGGEKGALVGQHQKVGRLDRCESCDMISIGVSWHHGM